MDPRDAVVAPPADPAPGLFGLPVFDATSGDASPRCDWRICWRVRRGDTWRVACFTPHIRDGSPLASSPRWRPPEDSETDHEDFPEDFPEAHPLAQGRAPVADGPQDLRPVAPGRRGPRAPA